MKKGIYEIVVCRKGDVNINRKSISNQTEKCDVPKSELTIFKSVLKKNDLEIFSKIPID